MISFLLRLRPSNIVGSSGNDQYATFYSTSAQLVGKFSVTPPTGAVISVNGFATGATVRVEILTRLARFVIADLTDARSVREELRGIVPNLPSVPVQPILLSSDEEYCMFEHVKRYDWVLETYRYDNLEGLLESLREKVITPAENKVNELQKRIHG